MNPEPLLQWIIEREAIRQRRAAGQPWPWTDDPILREWSFCNVHRENDRVTRWIADQWRAPHAADPQLWFTMVVARLVNWPDTLAHLGYPSPWAPERFLSVLQERKAQGAQRYGGAYMLRSAPGDKAAYHADKVLTPMWLARERLRPAAGDTLGRWHTILMTQEGMGSFLAAQIVADMKYVAPLDKAPDWWTFAASGPGSRRGLNRVLGRAVDARWNEEEWYQKLQELHTAITPELERLGIGRLHAQDVQSCLCELDKSERVRLGEGTPKRRYRRE